MRILVCGSRDWDDYGMIANALGYLPRNTILIHGAARGADTLAGQVADEQGWTKAVFPADWEQYGKAAGPIRNKQMLVEGQPELVIAFHDDLENSRGTKNMVEQAVKAGIPVVYIAHRTPILKTRRKAWIHDVP